MAEKKVVKPDPEKAIALGISSTGNYRIYRQLWNIDIPQDITNFRQYQEGVNKAMEKTDKETRYEYYYAKDMIDGNTKEMEELALEGIRVRDFVPTAGIIRITTEKGDKVDLVVNYPLDQLEEGTNLHALGRGIERKEEEFEGELFYTEDLRKKSLSEIKITEGITKDEAVKVLEQIETNPLLQNIKKALEERGIDLSEVDKTDLAELKEVFDALREEYKNLDQNDKEALKLIGVKGENDLKIALTAKDIVDTLQERGKLEGKVYGVQTEFYPLNGIILGETKDKKLVMVFSPERVHWKINGIGIAKQLDKPNYKVLNAMLTVLQNPYTYDLIGLMAIKDRLKEEDRKRIEKQYEDLLYKVEGLVDRLSTLGANVIEKTKDGEVETDIKIAHEVAKALGVEKWKENLKSNPENPLEGVKPDLNKFLHELNRLRKVRNKAIWEITGKERVDVNELLAVDKKYSEKGEKRYFLKWNTDEQRSPLGFYRDLFVLTNTDGRIRGDFDTKRVYNNDVRLIMTKFPTIIPTDPTKGRELKATDLTFTMTYKPIGFVVKNTSLLLEGEKTLFNLEKLRLGNRRALQEVEESVDKAIENGESPRKFIRNFFRELGAKVFINDIRVKENPKIGLYVETYLKPLAQTTEKILKELDRMEKALMSGDLKNARKHLNRYWRLTTEGLSEKVKTENGEEKTVYIAGLRSLRERMSQFKQAPVYVTFARELYLHFNELFPERVKLREWFAEVSDKIKDIMQKAKYSKTEEETKNVEKEWRELRKGIKEKMEEIKKEATAPEFVRELIKNVREYEHFKEKSLTRLQEVEKEFKRELELYEKLKDRTLTEKEKFELLDRTTETFKELFMKNADAKGLIKLSRVIDGKLDEIKDERLKTWWNEFKTELERAGENKVRISQVRENVGVGDSVGLNILKKMVAIHNRKAVEVEVKEAEKVMKEKPITIRVEEAEGLKIAEKEIPMAKGSLPLLVKDDKDMEKLTKKVEETLLKYGITKAEVVFKPAYATEDGVVYGMQIEVNGKEFTYSPQMNKIPTFESAFDNLKRKGLFEAVKEVEKETGRRVGETLKEATKEIRKEGEQPAENLGKQKEIKVETEEEQKEEQKQGKKKGKGKGLGMG